MFVLAERLSDMAMALNNFEKLCSMLLIFNTLQLGFSCKMANFMLILKSEGKKRISFIYIR